MTGKLDHRIATAEGATAAALRLRDQAESGRRIAQQRVRVLEEVVADVWRWTNNGHPHLELLKPVLERADTEYSLLAALDKLEATKS